MYFCHSYYSLRFGTRSPKQLVEMASKQNIKTLCLTDINNTTALFEFYKYCILFNIKAIAGIEFRNNNKYLYTGLAKNNEGINELNNFLTFNKSNKTAFPDKAPVFNNAYIIYPYERNKHFHLQENEYIGIRYFDINKLYSDSKNINNEKLIAFQASTFANEKDFFIHKHLQAIDNNLLLTQLQDYHLADKRDIFLSESFLNNKFESYPKIITHTHKLLDDCSFKLDNKPKNKKTFTGNKQDDVELLRKLAYEGSKLRYKNNTHEVASRIEKELQVICDLDFAAYFLITHDIIKFSMNNGYYHVGRGSGANSIVAYCLRITDVDPIELDLYFERFINPKRTSPPDFDIDYSWRDRDNILNYIFKKYPDFHTALLGTISVFKGKSILRELSKVYGLPKDEIDEFIRYPEKIINSDNLFFKIYQLAQEIIGFPNLRSIHAGGVIISEKPLTFYTALDMPPKGYPTTQWNMYTAEEIGFEKLDILSQRGLGHINDTIEIVKNNLNIDIDIHDIQTIKNDKRVKHQLQIGETIGCFYIESPAMRGLLKKLNCDDYIILVAASSIIRPGVAKSGMMKEYIRRYHNRDNIKYLHPAIEEQLKETFGVMVYQEDVLKVCHHFAGLDLADADILRRAMSGKFRSKAEFKKIEEKFFDNCKNRGYSNTLTNEVWRQIESFAGYSFSKAHSASYAVESFQSLFLKAYYPLEFITAVLNNFGGYYHSWVYINEAQRQGANIELPCINNSKYLSVIKDVNIYLGFVYINEINQNTINLIIEERSNEGEFKSFDNFILRTKISKEQLILLIRINALRTINASKIELLWQMQLYYGKKSVKYKMGVLFDTPKKEFALPKLQQTKLENAYDEMEILGFPISLSAFDMLQTSFRGEIISAEMNKHIGEKAKMMGRLVTIKYVYTVRKEVMNFGTFLDSKGNFFDTVHFPNSLKIYPFQGKGIYLILGKVVEEFGFPSIEVQKLARLPFKSDTRDK
ncbi:MAG: DNA polymerase III subunit alpha [Bacteroidales bacterium]|jgi:DNA-directed DNA polymerase III PolC|nr:DNA polymerase III subunit alpha [Bacteroidales bacterium]